MMDYLFLVYYGWVRSGGHRSAAHAHRGALSTPAGCRESSIWDAKWPGGRSPAAGDDFAPRWMHFSPINSGSKIIECRVLRRSITPER